MANITYQWRVIDCATYNELNGQQDVVYLINATLTATNQDTGYSNTIPVPVGVGYADLVNFKPFDQLTESEVIGWIEQHLNTEEIDRLWRMAAGNIDRVSIKTLEN
jgi:hypothetical protein